jgi:uncharacterized protein with GYD domain
MSLFRPRRPSGWEIRDEDLTVALAVDDDGNGVRLAVDLGSTGDTIRNSRRPRGLFALSLRAQVG